MTRFSWQLLLLLLVVFSADPAKADRRVALVIGNSNYVDATPLNNALNDANDIADALRRLKFDVVLGTDLDRSQTFEVLKEFNRKLVGADTAVLYYAGHALQVGGINFIAPIDTVLEHEVDLELETISMDLIRRQMERSAKTLLLFLDACRDNPLSRRFARKNRSTSAGRGLAKPEITSEGTFIAFSTQPGNVALDGTGRNSPFTKALLNHIEKPGIDISALMIDVRADVYEATNKSQLPWTNSGLLGRFYFNDQAPNAPSSSNTVDTRQSDLLKKFTAEKNAWEKIENSRDVQAITKFMTQFPNGIYSSVAKFKIDQLKDGLKQRASNENTRVNEQITTTLLTPSDDDLSKVDDAVTPLITKQLIRDFQRELNRIGCDAGVVDGNWGRKGRSALKKYTTRKNIQLSALEPSQQLLENLRSQDGRVCPLVCSPGFEIDGGNCVAKACISGQKRNSAGECYTPRAKRKTVQRRPSTSNNRKPMRKSSNCFQFNGKTICE